MQAPEIATIEDMVRVLDEHPQWLEALRARLLTRELLDLPQTLADFIAATDRRFDVLERQMDRLRTDIGPLKAAHARSAALDRADLIAEDLGLSLVGILGRDELRSLVQSADTDDISKDDLRSFRTADMVLRAADPAGTECYVAVEVSYTANGRDTERARRNARFLTRFTGLRASAVVASLRLDQRIFPAVESGEVAWFQLDADVLEVD